MITNMKKTFKSKRLAVRAIILWLASVISLVGVTRSEDYIHPPIAYERRVHEGPRRGAYNFGWDTGLYGAHAFHQERKEPDGAVTGRYGYTDPNGRLRLVHYRASATTGYQAWEGDEAPPPPPRPQRLISSPILKVVPASPGRQRLQKLVAVSPVTKVANHPPAPVVGALKVAPLPVFPLAPPRVERVTVVGPPPLPFSPPVQKVIVSPPPPPPPPLPVQQVIVSQPPPPLAPSRRPPTQQVIVDHPIPVPVVKAPLLPPTAPLIRTKTALPVVSARPVRVVTPSVYRPPFAVPISTLTSPASTGRICRCD